MPLERFADESQASQFPEKSGPFKFQSIVDRKALSHVGQRLLFNQHLLLNLAAQHRVALQIGLPPKGPLLSYVTGQPRPRVLEVI